MTERKRMKLTSFLNALGMVVYIIVVATIMQNGDKIFGKADNFVTPIAALLLFTLSAVVVGSLVLGKPLTMYLDGKKKEAVRLFVQTAGWLAAFTVIAFIITALV